MRCIVDLQLLSSIGHIICFTIYLNFLSINMLGQYGDDIIFLCICLQVWMDCSNGSLRRGHKEVVEVKANANVDIQYRVGGGRGKYIFILIIGHEDIGG